MLAAVYVLGLACALGLGPRRDPVLCGVIAFPLGLAAGVLAAMAMMLVGAPVTPVTACAVWLGIAAAMLGTALRRDAIDARTMIALAGAAIVLVVPTIALDRGVTRAARVAGEHALQLDAQWRALGRARMFELVARALLGEAPVAIPMLASGLGLAVVAAWRTRTPLGVALLVAIAAGASVALRAPPTLLFSFGALWWLGAIRPALVMLAAFAVSAPLAPFVAAPALLLALVLDRSVRAEALRPSLIAIAALIAWWTLPLDALPNPWLTLGAIAVFAAAGVIALLVGREIDDELLAPLGGDRRAPAVIFAGALVLMLVTNVRDLTAHQRRLPERWRITAHDAFDLEDASAHVKAASVELLEREP